MIATDDPCTPGPDQFQTGSRIGIVPDHVSQTVDRIDPGCFDAIEGAP